MPRHRRKYPQPSHSRLRAIVLPAAVVLLVSASVVGVYIGVYKLLIGGNGGHALTEANSRHAKTPVQVSPSARPAAAPTRASLTSCNGAPNTPGGRDPWGGCWPGPNNTGPSAGVTLTPYAGRVLPDGACMITANTIIVGKMMACQIIVNSGNLTLEDSSVIGEVYNYGSGTVLIKNSTINGGSAHTETVLGSNIIIENSNLYGNQHEVYCGNNCTIENSWLHDNYNGESLGWHQNGFISNGGSHYKIRHNSVYCVGGCTADISFIPDGNISDATVDRNLLVATRYASYCLYPSSDSPGKPGTVTGMVVTDNVFQRGANGKCAYYGAVYGWDAPSNVRGASGFHNVWSGNTWNDGKALAAP